LKTKKKTTNYLFWSAQDRPILFKKEKKKSQIKDLAVDNFHGDSLAK